MTTTDEAIREAKNRWARRRRRLIGYGQWHPFTEAEPVRQHVLAIKASGMGLRCVSKLTGVSIGSLEHLLYGKNDLPPAVKIRTESAEALLDFWPTLDDYEDRVHIDGTGTRRRIQALAMAGWPSVAIRDQLGDVATGTIEKLRSRTTVTARLARAVRDFYNQVSTKTAEEFGVTPWIANRTRGYAARHNWVMAAAWDDDTIDDPQAKPDFGDRVLSFHERAELRREEIIHFAWHGDTPEQILARLNGEVSISTVRQIVQDWRTGQKRDRTQNLKEAA
ncbi:hypothetical protein ACWCRC_32985 [Streptomyces sp. NPDC001940]